MDSKVEEKIINMEQNDCEANKGETPQSVTAEEAISEAGSSRTDNPDPESVVTEADPTKSPLKEKCKTPDDRNDCIYHIKWISRNGCKSPVITQVGKKFRIFLYSAYSF